MCNKLTILGEDHYECVRCLGKSLVVLPCADLQLATVKVAPIFQFLDTD